MGRERGEKALSLKIRDQSGSSSFARTCCVTLSLLLSLSESVTLIILIGFVTVIIN